MKTLLPVTQPRSAMPRSCRFRRTPRIGGGFSFGPFSVLASICLEQEDVKRAFEPEEEAAEEPNVDESGDESDGSESGFGVSMVLKKVKEPSRGTPPPAKQRKVKDEQGGKKAEKLMTKAKAINTTLNSTTALGMWQGMVKQKDVDTRIQKAYDSLASLEAETSEEGKNLHMDLKAGVALVENHASILADWDLSTLDISKLQNVTRDQVTMFATLPADCLNAMVADFGKKIIQDTLVRLNIVLTRSACMSLQECMEWPEKTEFFFKFVMMDNAMQQGLCLYALGQEEMCSLEEVERLKLQHTLCSLWMDSFKTLPVQKVDKVLQALPSDLWRPELARYVINEIKLNI